MRDIEERRRLIKYGVASNRGLGFSNKTWKMQCGLFKDHMSPVDALTFRRDNRTATFLRQLGIIS